MPFVSHILYRILYFKNKKFGRLLKWSQNKNLLDLFLPLQGKGKVKISLTTIVCFSRIYCIKDFKNKVFVKVIRK